MSTYRMQDGTIVKTENARQSWDEATYHDGHNRISKATGGQWEHQRLHRSRKGRFWLEYWSQWQGTHAHAEWLGEHEAARWLLTNEHPLPEDLSRLEAELVE